MKPSILITIFIALTVVASTSMDVLAQPHLFIRDHETRQVLFRFPLRYGADFTIRYIHSVDHFPVYEVFRVSREKGIVLRETYFPMFGAGMGHWEGHGKLIQDGKWIKIRDIDQPLGQFLLRVGSPGVDHTIVINGNECNLSGSVPGRRVEVMLSEN